MNKKIFVITFILFFCAISLLFYEVFSDKAEKKSLNLAIADSIVGASFPESNLVDSTGTIFDNNQLHTGKVILVFVALDCDNCLNESKFLSKVMHKRNDIKYYGVLVFGSDKEILKYAESKFPFKLFFDEKASLRKSLKIRGVPIKLLLENGIVKKIWIGSDPQIEEEFVKWIESLPLETARY